MSSLIFTAAGVRIMGMFVSLAGRANCCTAVVEPFFGSLGCQLGGVIDVSPFERMCRDLADVVPVLGRAGWGTLILIVVGVRYSSPASDGSGGSGFEWASRNRKCLLQPIFLAWLRSNSA
jgi:hypothetical protein